MTKIDIISGFLGAGKTTLIKKLLSEALVGEKVVLIENEFGEIGIDGGFLKESGIEIREMNSGCICCSLVGDFSTSLKEVIDMYHPERILIEPSGVGKLSDVIKAVEGVKDSADIELESCTTVVDVNKCKMYLRNFGEFYQDQAASAGAIILSRTDTADEGKAQEAVELLRTINQKAVIVTTPVDMLPGDKLFDAMRHEESLEQQLMGEHHHGHGCAHGHHGDHEHCCGNGHHEEHQDDVHCCGHGHHEEDQDHKHCCGHGHHEEDQDHEHCCGHGHHQADEIFNSFGMETVKTFNREELKVILQALETEEVYGTVLRAKGMVQGDCGDWIHFDMVPGEREVRSGQPDYTGRVCVIGSGLKEEALKELFLCS